MRNRQKLDRSLVWAGIGALIGLAVGSLAGLVWMNRSIQLSIAETGGAVGGSALALVYSLPVGLVLGAALGAGLAFFRSRARDGAA